LIESRKTLPDLMLESRARGASGGGKKVRVISMMNRRQQWRRVKPKIIAPRRHQDLMVQSKEHARRKPQGWLSTESSKSGTRHEDRRSTSPVSVAYGFPGSPSTSSGSLKGEVHVRFDPVVRFRTVFHVYDVAEKGALWWTLEECKEMRLREIWRQNHHPADEEDETNAASTSNAGLQPTEAQLNAELSVLAPASLESLPRSARPFNSKRRVHFDTTVKFRVIPHVYSESGRKALWWTCDEHQEMQRQEMLRQIQMRSESSRASGKKDESEQEILLYEAGAL